MRNRTLALLIIALFLVPMGLAYNMDEAEALSDTVVFQGELSYDNKPIQGATVYLKWVIEDDELEGVSEAKSDKNGRFKVNIPEANYPEEEIMGSRVTLTCVTDNHVRIQSIVIDGNHLFEYDSANRKIDLDKVKAFTRVYVLTKSINLEVSVEYGNVGIDGARVTLKNVDTGNIEIKTTDSAGVCKFECIPGDYEIRVEKGGFVNWESEEYLRLEQTAEVRETVKLTLAPVKTYWGFDMPHLFTIIGLVMALILTSLVLVYMFWLKRHPGPTRVIDDSPDYDDEDMER